MLGNRMPYLVIRRSSRSTCSSATDPLRWATICRHSSAASARPANQDVVGDHDRPKVPGHAVIACLQAEEIEQRVEHLAAVRLRGRAVVIDVGGVVLDDRFDGQFQPAGGLGTGDAAVEILEKLELRFGIFVFLQGAEPVLCGAGAKWPAGWRSSWTSG